jgi:hypothetical protein
MSESNSQMEFQLGLAMAGAISAGAYSAGVFDFLIQALEAWEAAKQDPLLVGQIPTHRVGIKVIVGASAGAITGALGAVALAGGIRPTATDKPLPSVQRYRYVLPNLYDAWVVRPNMIAPAGRSDFLKTVDLEDGADVVSALNSQVLTEIKDGALSLPNRGKVLPYVSATLDVYLTMSNLRGVPYAVSCTGGDYGMMSHGDRAHYRIHGLGTWNSPSSFANDDTYRTLDVKDLFGNEGPSGSWKDYALAAVTSGAFPIGLAAQQWHAEASEYHGRNWPLADAPTVIKHMKPTWPWPLGSDPAFKFTAVDGGLMNNEPFEYARYCLMKTPGRANPRRGTHADRAVIMIDPFPEPPVLPGDGYPKGDLVTVLMTLIPALRTQTQFKPSEVAVAAAGNVFSRFMISPHRTPPGFDQKEECFGIASGLLGGFGGFISRAFREHDFQLGRRNCQKFLADSLGLYEGNHIIQSWPQNARKNVNFHGARVDGKQLYQIIPLLGDALPEVPYPTWPRIDDEDLNSLQSAIELRIKKVAAALIAQKGPTWMLRRLMEIACHFSKKRAFNFVRLSILSDLVRRDQIKSWSFPTRWKCSCGATDKEIRVVLAALLNPSFDFMTERGLARTTGLDVGLIREILATCEAETNRPFAVWRAPWSGKSGYPIYTLVSRRPSLIWRLPGIRKLGDWFRTTSGDPPYV